MIQLLTLTFLTCTFGNLTPIVDRDIPGPSGVVLRERSTMTTKRQFFFELVDTNGKRIWKTKSTMSLPVLAPAFSKDGQSVALNGLMSYEVTTITVKGLLATHSFFSQLTKAEFGLIPRSNCGQEWIQSLEFEESNVIVRIHQRDSDQALPPLMFSLDITSGVIARR